MILNGNGRRNNIIKRKTSVFWPCFFRIVGYVVSTFSIITVLVVAFLIIDSSLEEAQEISFTHQGNTLVGHYLLPIDDVPSKSIFNLSSANDIASNDVVSNSVSSSNTEVNHAERNTPTVNNGATVNNNATAKGVILFVHGDGALPYDAEGYYPLIWNHLRRQGYAVFSWNKAGVGNSTGNWLDQSMLDRQGEVKAAIQFMQEKYGYKGEQIGLLGFSQAGWVVPAVANNNPNVGFVIGIGFAMNWLEQGWYLTKTRLLAELTKEETVALEKAALEKTDSDNIESENTNKTALEKIALAYQEHEKWNRFLQQKPDYQTYLQAPTLDKGRASSVMEEDRYNFVLKNLNSDAYDSYIGIQQPILMLFGEHDLNVDTQDSDTKLQQLFAAQDNLTLIHLSNATHGLLNAENFNQQVPDLGFLLKLLWMDEEALAPDVLPVLDEWLQALPSQEPLTNEPLDKESLANEPLGKKPLANEPLDNVPLGDTSLENELLDEASLEEALLINTPSKNEPLANEPLINELFENELLEQTSSD